MTATQQRTTTQVLDGSVDVDARRFDVSMTKHPLKIELVSPIPHVRTCEAVAQAMKSADGLPVNSDFVQRQFVVAEKVAVGQQPAVPIRKEKGTAAVRKSGVFF